MTSVQRAIRTLEAGRMVLLLDDRGESDVGFLVMAAEKASEEDAGFFMRNAGGMVFAALTQEDADELDLAPIVPKSDALELTIPFAVKQSVAASHSPARLAATFRALAQPDVGAAAFVRPGHVFAVRTEEFGVLVRAAPAEGAVDLCRLAGLAPIGVVAELNGAARPSMRWDPLQFAERYGLCVLHLRDLVQHRRSAELSVQRRAVARLPTIHGVFSGLGYTCDHSVPGYESDFMVLIAGKLDWQGGFSPPANTDDVVVDVHVECEYGDVFRSQQCKCSQRLRDSMRSIATSNLGALIYLRRVRWASDRPPSHGIEIDSVAESLRGAVMRDLRLTRVHRSDAVDDADFVSGRESVLSRH